MSENFKISEKEKLQIQIGIHQENIKNCLEKLIAEHYFEKMGIGEPKASTLGQNIKDSMLALSKLRK